MTFNILGLRRKAAFRSPLHPSPRTALLGPWFRRKLTLTKASTRVFANGWCKEAADFAPATIVGTREQLLILCENPPCPTHAVVAIVRPGEADVSLADRELLWRAFRVPLFQQIIGDRGELLAAECDAHDGLHIEVPASLWEGYSIDKTPCACGRKTPRVSPSEVAERARSAAAFAR